MTSNNNIPQGYKQTEFGYIPLDWNICTFKDVLSTFSSGATPYRGIPEYYKGEVRWISSGELNYNHIYDTLEHISEQAVKNTNLRVHQPDTFLIAITGLEAEGTRGRCAIVAAPSTTNQSCLAINGTDKMCVEYLFWFYSMWGEYLAFKYSQGTKQQSFTAEIVKKLPIYCPSNIAEQKAIATALSDVDALIAALDKKIAKKKLIKQGAMQQLLTGKKRLPGFTEEWVDTTIGNISELMKGNGLSKEKLSMSGKYKCILYGEIFTYYNYVVEKCKSRTDSREGLKSEIGDVILPGSTTTKGIDLAKAVCIKENDILLGGDVIIIRNSKKEFCSDFLAIYLSEVNKEAIAEKSQGTTIIHLHAPQLAEVKICIPSSIKEQQVIATILSDMDKEISDLEAKRDKYRLIKQGMMQKLLTGQIRLKTT